MKTHIFISVFISPLILSCGQKAVENQVETSPESLKVIEVADHLKQAESTPFALSESVSTIDIVPLEVTDFSLVANINKVVTSKTNIFVLDNRNAGVLRFDRTGHFLNQIGKKGQGQGEYLSIVDFCIDDTRQEVYILSAENGALVYDYEGTYKRDYPKLVLHEVFAQMQARLAIHDGSIFLKQSSGIWYPDNYPKDSLWSLALVNEELLPRKLFLNPAHRGHEQEIEKQIAPLSGWKNYWIEDEPRIDQYDGNFWMKYPDADTIYQYEKEHEAFHPVYAVDLGDRKAKDYMASHQWIKSRDVFDNLYIKTFFHTKDFIYLVGSQGETIYTVCYDKGNGNTRISQRHEDLFTQKFPNLPDTYKRIDRDFILRNDISGGDFKVDFTSGNEWISVIDQETNIEKYISSKGDNVLSKEQQMRLHEKISLLSDENSNPILLIANLK